MTRQELIETIMELLEKADDEALLLLLISARNLTK